MAVRFTGGTPIALIRSVFTGRITMKLSKTLPRATLLVVSGAAIALGCAKSPHQIEPARTAGASAEERDKIVKAEREVDEARAALTRVKEERAKAERFKNIVVEERSAAESQLEAARQNVELVRGTEEDAMARQYPEQPSEAEAQDGTDRSTAAADVRDSFQLRLEAARAKEAFATALVDLWEKQEDVAEATVAHRESAVELTRYEVAAEAGTAKDLNRMDFVEAEARAREDVEMKQLQVTHAETRVKDLRTEWEQAREKAMESSGGQIISDAPPPADLGSTQEERQQR
jgi:hypothetical protein